ncbi:MAG: Trk system potassium transporter TrkA, partial [Rhodobacteraceae bacterium]|nr:Trk system potassium transporter TrkA [Paracoccaceae bacterium]
HSDEVNMVVCQVAHSIFGVPRKIARLRSQSYLDAIYSDLYRRDHLPIDVVISPELEVAEAALKRLSTPTSFDTESFLDGQAQLLGFRLDENCPVINTPLRQLTDLFSTLRTIVVGVRRQGVLFAPEAGDQLFSGDECYVMCHHQDRLRTTEIFGKPTAKQERIVIVGGGNVGQRVAQALEQDDRRMRIKVIERNRSVAEEAADALERTIVLNGDGLDSTLLIEAGIGRADAVLAITDDDKTNMLAAVRAKSMGCKMAIALINDPTMVPMMGTLGIDAHINPRATTVSSILRHIRHGRVRDVYSIGDAEAEVIEAQVLNTSPIAGQRIRDINFPEGVLIG